MTQVAATEFVRNFGQYREAAQREPVTVVAHRRVAGHFLSARDFAEYQQLKARQAQALYPHELGLEDTEMLATARAPDSARELDHLLD